MTRNLGAVVGLVAIASVSFVAARRSGDSETPFTEVDHHAAQTAGTSTPPSTTPTLRSVPFAERLNSSDDYWSLANELLGPAKSGAPDAQYYLFRVLEYCRDRSSFFLMKGNDVLPLDEVLQYAAQRNIAQEFAQQAFDRCHEFLGHDSSAMGNEDQWLVAAAKSAVPEAQADAAIKMIIYEDVKNLAIDRGQPIQGFESKLVLDASPESLLREALKTKSPYVLARISDALPAIGQPDSPELDTERFALLLLACQRGYDCTSNAEWVQASCGFHPQCAGFSDPTQLVMEATGSKWTAVQQRAAELGEKIDASAWDEMGFTSDALED